MSRIGRLPLGKEPGQVMAVGRDDVVGELGSDRVLTDEGVGQKSPHDEIARP